MSAAEQTRHDRSTKRSVAAARCAPSCPTKCRRRRCAKYSSSRSGRLPTATCSPGRRMSSPAPALKRLREALVDAGMRDEPIKPDWPADSKFVGVYRERQVDAAQQLYGAMGVERRDLVGRKLAYVRNHAFFDAPHVVFIFMPEPFDTREATDIGMYAQTLMLALDARGIASCAQGALGLFPDIVREQLGRAPPTTDCCSASRSATRIRKRKPTPPASGAPQSTMPSISIAEPPTPPARRHRRAGPDGPRDRAGRRALRGRRSCCAVGTRRRLQAGRRGWPPRWSGRSRAVGSKRTPKPRSFRSVEAAGATMGSRGCEIVIECVQKIARSKTRRPAPDRSRGRAERDRRQQHLGPRDQRARAGVARPATRFLGLHFFSPADRMALVEVVKGPETSETDVRRRARLRRADRQTTGSRARRPRLLRHPRLRRLSRRSAWRWSTEGVAPQSDRSRGDRQRPRARTAGDAGRDGYRPQPAAGPAGARGRAGAALLPPARRARARASRRSRAASAGAPAAASSTGPRTGRENALGGARRAPSRSRAAQPDVEAIKLRLLVAEAREALRCLEEGVIASADDGDAASVLGLGFPEARRRRSALGGGFRARRVRRGLRRARARRMASVSRRLRGCAISPRAARGLEGLPQTGERRVTGPLQGFRIVEMGGIGPAPFAGGLLGDLGADVVRIDRIAQAGRRTGNAAALRLLQSQQTLRRARPQATRRRSRPC